MSDDFNLEAIFSEIAAGEARNREPAMQVLMREVAVMHEGKVLPGRELVNGVMSDAMDRGVQAICLDTVAHRDSRAQTLKAVGGGRRSSAHEVYLKSGFKMVGIKVIDPGNKKLLEEEGLKVNQLNGPLEYGVSDLRPLREAVYEAFEVPVELRLRV